MAEGYIGVPDQSTFGLSSGTGVKVIDTNEITLVNTTSANPVTSDGLNTITPAAMTNIAVGVPLIIDNITSGVQETVVVVATTGSTFSAYFRNLHTSGFSIVLNVERQNFSIGDPNNIANVATVSGSALNVNQIGGLGSNSGNPQFAQLVGTVPVSGTVSVSGNTYDGSGNLNVNLKTALPSGTNYLGSVSISGIAAVSGALSTSTQDLRVSGVMAATTLNSSVSATLGSGQSTMAIEILNNVSGATISFQVTNEGIIWNNINVIQEQTNAVVSSITSTNFFGRANVSGFYAFRVIVTTTSTISNIVAYLYASVGSQVMVLESLPSGTNQIGTVGVIGTVPISGNVSVLGTTAISGAVSIGTSLPAGNNTIGAVSLATSSVTGTISASVLNSYVLLNINGGQSTALISITGNTTGATLQVVGYDNNNNAQILNIVNINTGAVSTSFTNASIDGYVNVTGFANVRVTVSTVSTAATITVSIVSTATPYLVGLNYPLPPGTNTIGNVALNASTANIGSVKLLDTGGSNVASINGNGALSTISYNDSTSTYFYNTPGSTNVTVKTGVGRLISVHLWNASTGGYGIIFDSAGAVTPGTTTPLCVIPQYAPTGYTVFLDVPYTNGIVIYGNGATGPAMVLNYR